MRQQSRLDDRRQTDMGFRHPEDRVVGGDRQVAGDEEFQARAESRTANLGNDRRRELTNRQKGPVQSANEALCCKGVETFHLADVRAAAEHAVAARDDQHPRTRHGRLDDRRAQRRRGCGIERVRPGASGQRDSRHVAIEVESDVGHRSSDRTAMGRIGSHAMVTASSSSAPWSASPSRPPNHDASTRGSLGRVLRIGMRFEL